MKQIQTNKIEWKEVELKELGELIMGQSPKGNTYNLEKKGVPLLNGAADIKNNKINPKQFTTRPTKLSKKRDILFCIRATIGKSIISDGEYCLGRGVAGFRANSNLLKSNFLLKLLDEKLKELIPQGSTIVGVKGKDIERLKIPLPFLPDGSPNLKEQERIVKILEDSEKLNKTGKKLENLFNEYLKSIFYELFGDPILKKSKYDKLSFLKCLEKEASNNKLKLQQKDFLEKGKYPIIDQGEKFIAGYTDNKEKVYLGKLPVIIFGDHTRILKFVNFPFALGADGVKILVPNQNFDSIYFYYCLKLLDIESAGYSRHYKFLKQKEIPLPPPPLQQKFSRIVEQIEKMKTNLNKTKQNSKELFNSLMQKAFRGEL